MSPEEAADYHAHQLRVFAASAADMVTAITMTNVNEAVGIARAAQAEHMPVAISFTVETDGALPTGQALSAAIEEVDAATGSGPEYYMINCAHPTHFDRVLEQDFTCAHRLRGLRANASKLSHQELNDASELDSGNPVELGSNYAELVTRLPRINILGGCCGTDHRHVEEIAKACKPNSAVAV